MQYTTSAPSLGVVEPLLGARFEKGVHQRCSYSVILEKISATNKYLPPSTNYVREIARNRRVPKRWWGSGDTVRKWNGALLSVRFRVVINGQATTGE